MKIPHFRGVFSRDTLPDRPFKNECAVINLSRQNEPGTHWTCYRKSNNIVHYFDSYGDLAPPLELQKYFNGCTVNYNYLRYQADRAVNCGHLCLKFLSQKL